MMKAGKHVLSEKPMALNSADCEKMLAAAKEYNRVLMIGQCLRFEPAYLYLKKCVDEGTFGKLKNMRMHRMSSHPMWGFEQWYTKTEKSGGCIMDLHIHDVDMARYLFGEPNAVSCWTRDGDTLWAVENTRMYFDDVMVVINGSWDESRSCKFRSIFRVRFEKATVLSAPDRKVMVYPKDGEPFMPEFEETEFRDLGINIKNIGDFKRELGCFADAIINGKKESPVPLSEAIAALRLIRHELNEANIH
jgi:predicted dehydrogenase